MEDNDWVGLSPLGPRPLGDAAATVEDGRHVDHCGLQVFELFSSDSGSEEECDNASEFDDCVGL
jgi:hypothetical protein